MYNGIHTFTRFQHLIKIAQIADYHFFILLRGKNLYVEHQPEPVPILQMHTQTTPDPPGSASDKYFFRFSIVFYVPLSS